MKTHWKKIALLSLIAVFITADVSYAALTVNPDVNGLTNDVKSAADNFSTAVRSIFGVVTAAFIIWGGVLMLMAHGNAQKISEAKSKFTYALGALIVVFMADKIVSVIMGIFGMKVG